MAFIPYKRVVAIDEKKILIIRDKTLIPCCCPCGYKKIYYLNNIKKVVIYMTSKPDPNVGFKKLLSLGCEIVSSDGEKEYLFTEQMCDEQQFNEFQIFFKSYFDTEFKDANTEMKSNLTPEENEPITTNSNDDNNIKSKPSMNEEAATPIFA